MAQRTQILKDDFTTIVQAVLSPLPSDMDADNLLNVWFTTGASEDSNLWS